MSYAFLLKIIFFSIKSDITRTRWYIFARGHERKIALSKCSTHSLNTAQHPPVLSKRDSSHSTFRTKRESYSFGRPMSGMEHSLEWGGWLAPRSLLSSDLIYTWLECSSVWCRWICIICFPLSSFGRASESSNHFDALIGLMFWKR